MASDYTNVQDIGGSHWRSPIDVWGDLCRYLVVLYMLSCFIFIPEEPTWQVVQINYSFTQLGIITKRLSNNQCAILLAHRSYNNRQTIVLFPDDVVMSPIKHQNPEANTAQSPCRAAQQVLTCRGIRRFQRRCLAVGRKDACCTSLVWIPYYTPTARGMPSACTVSLQRICHLGSATFAAQSSILAGII
eukprot:scaffold189141_cov33-Prasinocladus_malaysianus.AAC.1